MEAMSDLDDAYLRGFNEGYQLGKLDGLETSHKMAEIHKRALEFQMEEARGNIGNA